ncbi:MAG: helix-turn-helix transcriptional regulator, partial [Pseudomonadota bacterium]|nr:helix-turn-helix transcriptional regulator [Pseudomonadota bacterium]
MAEHAFKQHIAQHLKALRKAQGLSLDSVAKLTGVSKAMLGQIERQESSPTISTLWKIASGLDASFSAFFATGNDEKAGDDNFPEDPNMKVKAIFSYREDTRMEV